MRPNTSVYLDLIRLLAAAVVLAGHASTARVAGDLPGLWRFVTLGNDAVVIFFVLSGFVIAYVADQKERTLKSYSISRFARLYSVALPAIVLTAILDAVGSRLAPTLYDPQWFVTDNPVWRIAANLLFLNELWFTSVRPFSNVPFWSLGYEFWYYVVFAVSVHFSSWYRIVVMAVILLIVGPKILLLLPVWLLGVWAYFGAKAVLLSERIGGALAFGSLACYLAFRWLDAPMLLDGVTEQWLGKAAILELQFSKFFLSSYVIGILAALHFVGISAISHRLGPVLPERPIRYFASLTFALYLFHYPLLYFFTAVLEFTGMSAYRSLLVPISMLAVVWALGELTERRKSTAKRWVASCYEKVAKLSNERVVFLR